MSNKRKKEKRNKERRKERKKERKNRKIYKKERKKERKEEIEFAQKIIVLFLYRSVYSQRVVSVFVEYSSSFFICLGFMAYQPL